MFYLFPEYQFYIYFFLYLTFHVPKINFLPFVLSTILNQCIRLFLHTVFILNNNDLSVTFLAYNKENYFFFQKFVWTSTFSIELINFQ